MPSLNKDGFEAAMKVALDGMGVPEKFNDVLAEYDKKGRFFFVVECALTMDSLVAEMSAFPEAQRRQINPMDVIRGYESRPNNLRQMSHRSMSLLLKIVESTFDLGVKIETSGSVEPQARERSGW
jgi:hypothetical protein